MGGRERTLGVNVDGQALTCVEQLHEDADVAGVTSLSRSDPCARVGDDEVAQKCAVCRDGESDRVVAESRNGRSEPLFGLAIGLGHDSSQRGDPIATEIEVLHRVGRKQEGDHEEAPMRGDGELVDGGSSPDPRRINRVGTVIVRGGDAGSSISSTSRSKAAVAMSRGS